MCYYYKFLEIVVIDSKDKGFIFNQIAEMNIIPISIKLDMSYDYYIKHNLHAAKWKLFSMID